MSGTSIKRNWWRGREASAWGCRQERRSLIGGIGVRYKGYLPLSLLTCRTRLNAESRCSNARHCLRSKRFLVRSDWRETPGWRQKQLAFAVRPLSFQTKLGALKPSPFLSLIFSSPSVSLRTKKKKIFGLLGELHFPHINICTTNFWEISTF